MTTWNPRANDLFLQALELGSEEGRQIYLDEACNGDAALRAEVESLLEASDRAGAFLELPAAALVDTLDRTAGEGPGTVIGPYKLLEQIGEGGFGVVFMAEQQEPIRRRVALKILKPGMDTKQVIARFEAERQALALMDHPHIAKVFDGGQTASGRPYFVMELVAGVPITDYCDQRQLTPKERLDLFLRVCQAVQHAHQKGIIHRDLKPSNVIVAQYDAKPVPKIIDFGIAKATGPKLTEKTVYTEFGSVVGTPEYMSPEQAELDQADIDTRSDIYSLGVLLYELLTGTTPLERNRLKKSSLLDVLRIIREEEAPRPSTRLSTTGELPSIAAKRSLEPKKLSGLLRGELDWIVMKALEKDRNRRYQTANSMALDVERYLRNEPVDACPPGAVYRMRKYASRHKAALAIATMLAIALLLIVGTIAGSVGWVLRDKEARQSKTHDAVQAALHEVRALQGERKWREALAGIQRVEELLTPMESGPELEQSVRDLRIDLEMVGKLEEIRSRQGEFNKQEAPDFGASDAAYARAFRDYGVDCEALDATTAGKLLGARAIAVELAITLDEWAAVQRHVRKHNGKGWKHLLAVARVADPDPWRVRLRDALERNQPEVLKALANSKEVPGMPLRTLRRLAKALAELKEWDEAARLLLEVQKLHPNDFWTNSQLAWALDQQKPPRSVAAVRFATVAAALRDENEVMHFNLGWYLERAGQFDDAVASYARAIQLRPDYADAQANMSRALARAEKVGPAIAVYQEAVRRRPDSAPTHYFLGAALKKKGDLDSAAASFREALRLNPTHGAAREELVNILSKQGKDAEVETVYRQFLAALDAAIDRSPQEFNVQVQLAWFLTTCPAIRLQDASRALAAAQAAVKIDPKSDLAWQVLGWAHYRNGDWRASIDALEKSIGLQTSPPGGDSWQWFFLAMAHWQLGNHEQAQAWYLRAVKWLDENAPNLPEGRRFQAEAAALVDSIGKQATKSPSP